MIDSHGLMLAYLADAEAHGAMIAYHAPLERAAADGDGIVLEIGGTAPMLLRAGRVVNCAGLHAPALALRFEGRSGTPPPTAYLCKGTTTAWPAARPSPV